MLSVEMSWLVLKMKKKKIKSLILVILCTFVILGTFISNMTSYLLSNSGGNITLVRLVVIEILSLGGLLIISTVCVPFLGPLLMSDTPRSPSEKIKIGLVILSVLMLIEGVEIARKKPDTMLTSEFVVNNNFILDSSSTNWDIPPGPKLKVGNTEYRPPIDVPIPNVAWKVGGRILNITLYIIALYFIGSGILPILKKNRRMKQHE